MMPAAQSMNGPDKAHLADFVRFRRRPQPVQSLDFRPGSLEVTLFWNAPADRRGIDRWRIYKDNEKNLINEIPDRAAKQYTVKVPGNTKAWFYVASVSDFGLESPRIGVLANSNTDSLVSSGTGGAIGGSSGGTGSGWSDQTSGGTYDTSSLLVE